MKELLISVAVLAATILSANWAVETWLGEDRRFWLGIAGLGVLAAGSALVQASGIGLLTRALRGLLIGGIVRRYGPDWPWLRKLLRFGGIETEPETRTPEELKRSGLHWSSYGTALLVIGQAISLVAAGMVWVGFFGG